MITIISETTRGRRSSSPLRICSDFRLKKKKNIQNACRLFDAARAHLKYCNNLLDKLLGCHERSKLMAFSSISLPQTPAKSTIPREGAGKILRVFPLQRKSNQIVKGFVFAFLWWRGRWRQKGEEIHLGKVVPPTEKQPIVGERATKRHGSFHGSVSVNTFSGETNGYQY